MSLDWAFKSTPPIIALCGQSNCQGFLTGAATSLPATDLEGDPTVTTKPAGVSFYEDGVLQAGWTNPFGPEVGIASVLPNCVILKKGENGTAIGSWSGGAGHMVTAVSNWSTAGYPKPDVLVWVQGEADSDIEATANAYYGQLFTLLARAKNVAGGAMGFVPIRIPVTDAAYPYADTIRAAQARYCLEDHLGGKCNYYLDPTTTTWWNAGTLLQADGVHLTGMGMYMYGKMIGEYLLSEGYG